MLGKYLLPLLPLMASASIMTCKIDAVVGGMRLAAYKPIGRYIIKDRYLLDLTHSEGSTTIPRSSPYIKTVDGVKLYSSDGLTYLVYDKEIRILHNGIVIFARPCTRRK